MANIAFYVVVLVYVVATGMAGAFWNMTPQLFGLSDYRISTRKGRRIFFLLCCFPLVLTSAVYLGWRADGVSKLVVLLPAAYVYFMRLLSPHNNERIFSGEAEVSRYHEKLFTNKWRGYAQLLRNSDSKVFVYRVFVPDKEIGESIARSSAVELMGSRIRKTREWFTGGIWYVDVYLKPSFEVNEKDTFNLIDDLASRTWQLGGELADWRYVSEDSAEFDISGEIR